MQNNRDEQNILIDPVMLEMYMARGRRLRAEAIRGYGQWLIALIGKGADGVVTTIRRMLAGSAAAR